MSWARKEMRRSGESHSQRASALLGVLRDGAVLPGAGRNSGGPQVPSCPGLIARASVEAACVDRWLGRWLHHGLIVLEDRRWLL